MKTLLETFRYPRLGPGMMWAARDHVVNGGNEVLMGHNFKRLSQDRAPVAGNYPRPAPMALTVVSVSM